MTADRAILATLAVTGSIHDVEYGWTVYRMALISVLKMYGMSFIANAMARDDYETFNIELIDGRNNERKIIR